MSSLLGTIPPPWNVEMNYSTKSGTQVAGGPFIATRQRKGPTL